MAERSQQRTPRSKLPVPVQAVNRQLKKSAAEKSNVPDFSQLHKAWENKFQKGKAQAKKPLTQVQPFKLNHEVRPQRQLRSSQPGKENGPTGGRPPQQWDAPFATNARSKENILQERHIAPQRYGGLTSRATISGTSNSRMISRRSTVDRVGRPAACSAHTKPALPQHRMSMTRQLASATKGTAARQTLQARNPSKGSSSLFQGDSFVFKPDPQSLRDIINGNGIGVTHGQTAGRVGPMKRATFAGQTRLNPFSRVAPCEPRRGSIFSRDKPPDKNDPFVAILNRHLAQQNQLKTKWRQALALEGSTTKGTPMRKQGVIDDRHSRNTHLPPPTPGRLSTQARWKLESGLSVEAGSKYEFPGQESQGVHLCDGIQQMNTCTPRSSFKRAESGKKSGHVTWADVLSADERNAQITNERLHKPRAATQLNFDGLSSSIPKPLPLPRREARQPSSNAEAICQLTEQFHLLSPAMVEDNSSPPSVKASSHGRVVSPCRREYAAPVVPCPIPAYATPTSNHPSLDIQHFPLYHCRTKARTPYNKEMKARAKQENAEHHDDASFVDTRPDGGPCTSQTNSVGGEDHCDHAALLANASMTLLHCSVPIPPATAARPYTAEPAWCAVRDRNTSCPSSSASHGAFRPVPCRLGRTVAPFQPQRRPISDGLVTGCSTGRPLTDTRQGSLNPIAEILAHGDNRHFYAIGDVSSRLAS